MGVIGLFIRDTLWKYVLLTILIFLAVYILFGKKIKDLQQKFFAKFADGFVIFYNGRTEKIKIELFKGLKETVSSVLDSKNRGMLRILEIGVGSGANFKYFPQQSRMVVVDPNAYFEQYFNENKAKFPGISVEKFITCGGENMREVESESVDAVVTTLVLCSVTNAQQVLREIQRVLVPGGKYYYLEHIADGPTTRRFKIQNFLTRFGWHTLFDCNLNRRTDEAILKAGFSKVDHKVIRINSKDSTLLKLIEPHVVGFATK